jgi:rRNA maturation RNase YbeY
MYISIHTVAHNASKYQQSFEAELNRVMVHGVLHLLGFNDSNQDEVNQMRQAEDSCLALLNNLA